MAIPTRPAPVRSLPSNRFLFGWALSWAAVGCVVAGVIVATSSGRVDVVPALRFGILTAEVVGFTALVSTRLVFPLFARLPYLLFLALQVLTLLMGTLFGGVVVLFVDPLFSLAKLGAVASLLGVNGLIAVAVGIALYTYDQMRRQIEASYAALRERDAMERELRVARDVQQELLPHRSPEVRGLELAGVCRPAIGVGGDYYDFLPFGDDRVALLVADVSGKGVPAALLMAGLQASVRTMLLPDVGPAALVGRLNAVLFASSSASRYATLFYGDYDATSRTLRYTNAGHHPPMLLNAAGCSRLEGAGGMPIGMFEEARYGEARVTLQRGDLLALFTDGVVEAPGPDGEEFGARRLTELLARDRERPLDAIVEDVLAELGRWTDGAEAFDDVTLVLGRAT